MKEAVVFTVWDRAGATPYLTRVILGRLRIHIFHRGDADADPHDHPADFWTFPLVSYVEEYLDKAGLRRRRVVKAFRLHRRRAEHAHRVIGSAVDENRPIVTLVWWGRKRREWGFHTPAGWVHWKRYHGLENAGDHQP
jgi:hypothetical protein